MNREDKLYFPCKPHIIQRDGLSMNNIFDSRVGDATGYLAFYVVIPVLITVMSLRVFPTKLVSGVYCYVTIFVNVLNGIYDGANRWRSGIKCRRNAKILAILFFDGIVAVYCLYVIFSVLIMNNMDCRNDCILFVYVGTCFIAIWDFVASFLKDVTLKKEIGGATI